MQTLQPEALASLTPNETALSHTGEKSVGTRMVPERNNTFDFIFTGFIPIIIVSDAVGFSLHYSQTQMSIKK